MAASMVQHRAAKMPQLMATFNDVHCNWSISGGRRPGNWIARMAQASTEADVSPIASAIATPLRPVGSGRSPETRATSMAAHVSPAEPPIQSTNAQAVLAGGEPRTGRCASKAPENVRRCTTAINPL
jgi:hypothetical protein